MPLIQENMTRCYSDGQKVGKKKHSRYSITIPHTIVEFMGWKKGDELEFRLVEGKVMLKRKEI